MNNSTPSPLFPRIVHPYPLSAQWGTDFLLISSPIRIQFSPEIGPDLRQWMGDLWRRYTFDRIPVEVSEAPVPGRAGWSWRIGESELPVLASGDTYALQVGLDGVAAVGVNENGARDAWKTLLQLLELRDIEATSACVALPYVTLHDAPAMAFRGLHLCIFPETTPLFVEKVIQLLGLLKYSHVVLEFWGMLKLEALPELSWPTAWSKSQAAELIQLARAWGIEVVPMFNMSVGSTSGGLNLTTTDGVSIGVNGGVTADENINRTVMLSNTNNSTFLFLSNRTGMLTFTSAVTANQGSGYTSALMEMA